MVYKFRLLSDEAKNFVRDVELLSDQTFYDFHRILTYDLHYDKSQIASFFISNEKWEKLLEITLFDMREEGNRDPFHVMDKTLLHEFVNREKQRLLYIFDFFNERLFFIELIEISERKAKTAYPRITFSKGLPPQQLIMDTNNFGDFSFDE